MFHAVASQKHENDFADSYSCEFGQKQIFRRFLLPKQVDVDGVTAQLEKNILQIRAPIKAVAAKAFAAAAGAGPSAISSPGLNQVMTIIRPYAAGPVTENTTLDDLGLSSLERLMLTMELELQLGILISDTESQALHSVGEIAQIMRSMTQ
jgi:acyl carrier protein